MLRISNIRLPAVHTSDDLRAACTKKLGVNVAQTSNLTVVRKSLDARRKSDIHYVYTVDVATDGEKAYLSLPDVALSKTVEYIPVTHERFSTSRPVVVGSGPAGLFAALILAKAGLCPIVLERGKPAIERKADVDVLHKSGQLNPESNVLFGEGGAGTFSDGKLTTGIKDPRCGYVLKQFHLHGGPEEILYSSKPHLGTDNLMNIVVSLRREIESLGGEFRFQNRLDGFAVKGGRLASLTVSSPNGQYDLSAESAILAIGHSARDTFKSLHSLGVHMLQKPFSMGFRIEHPQELINRAQYGSLHSVLPPADYKLSAHLKNGRGVYTFCMCPGGTVVCSASEDGHLAVNGMSLYRRDGENANSALLVGVSEADFPSAHPLSGFELQRKHEQLAFELGGSDYTAPGQRVEDFLSNVTSTAFGDVIPSYRPGVAPANLGKIYPNELISSLREAIHLFDRKLPGFMYPDAVLTGVETRSSSPIRVVRDENYQSNVTGLIPCGEGCGYAGGIMSAAVDGIKCAEKIIKGYFA